MPAAASLGSVPLFQCPPPLYQTHCWQPHRYHQPVPQSSQQAPTTDAILRLTPLPTKVVEKILRGDNLDMKELLADNVALLKRIQEVNAGSNLQAITSTSKLREVTDLLTWTYCMLSFLAVKVPNPEARQIIAYIQIVIDLARKHPGLSYDTLFHQQMNAGGLSRWNELNTQAECSLLSLDNNLANARQLSDPTHNPPRRSFPSASYPSQRAPAGKTCRRFNRGYVSSDCANTSTRATHASGVTTRQ